MPSSATALHLRADEKGTSVMTLRASAGQRAARASLVLLWVAALAASADAASTTCASVAPPTPAAASTSSSLEVRVPVLSRHRTSTWLRLSMALDCWTSAPNLMIRTAPSA